MLIEGAVREVDSQPSTIRRALTILRHEGWIALWYRVLGETVYRRVLLLELDLPPRAAAPRGIEARWLRPEEAEAYAAFHPALTVHEVGRRLAAGERCLVLEKDERIVHGRWCAVGRAHIEYLQMPLPLPRGVAYVYQSFTAPEERGSGYASAGAVIGGLMLHREGFDRVLACIQPDRAIVYPPVFNAGYRPAGYLGWFRLGFWRVPFRTKSAGFPWYAPRPQGRQSAYWDSVGSETTSYLDWFLARLKRREHLALIRRWGGIPEQGRVLKTDLFEEANGSDLLLDALHEGSKGAIGIDISPAVAGAAARRVGALGQCAATDVRHLPFDDGCFDLVVSPSTLDHFSDRKDLGRSLSELCRVLRPGGRLILTLDNKANLTDPLLRLASRLRLTPYYLAHSYTAAELHRELEAAGFRVLSTDWILHAPRLVPVTAVKLARLLGSGRFERWVHRSLLRAQALRHSRWRARTGAFVAALAERRSAEWRNSLKGGP